METFLSLTLRSIWSYERVFSWKCHGL